MNSLVFLLVKRMAFQIPQVLTSSRKIRSSSFCSPGLLCFVLSILLSLWLIWLPIKPISAATLPNGFTETLLASGLSSPTAMALAPDGRIFVCLQGGSLRVVKNGALLATPFLTLSVNSSGERGLLGVAFDPNVASNQYVYVYYTVSSGAIHNRVSRFTANGDVAVVGSEVILLELDNLTSATNHNGGALHFGPDGKLYVAVGENATPSNSQTLTNLLGKMLRLNADGSIPTDNPFFNQTTGNNRAIWTLGLRNPFTFNFQPGTGRLFINDVGQGTWEEINNASAGANFGWPNCEGPCNPPNANFSNPHYYYANDVSTCAITGGTFYNPSTAQFPAEYSGKYFFAEYCAGWIKFIDPNAPPSAGAAPTFATGLSFPVDLQVSDDGSLYYLQRGNGGQLWRIQYTANQSPSFAQHPANQTVSVGQSATFTVSVNGSLPLTYQWRRNDVDIPNANAASYTINSVSAADNNARFRCFVSNSFGNALSNEATLTVVGNQTPTATITTPIAGTLYSGGEVINFSGTATDPEQGALPASAFTWEVVFHHDTHTHPFVPPTSGVTSGSFTIPTTGETAANVWYRIYLTVTDNQNATQTVFRDVFPRTVQLTLASNPSGLQLTLDGQPITTPYSVTGVVGIQRSLGVVSPQTVNGTTYNFSSWSDNGASTHTIATPASNTIYTAKFALPSGLVRARKSDFDGDGKTDVSVWRGQQSNWLILRSSNGTLQTAFWGASYAPYNDLAVPGDYDGDGKTDVGVFRRLDGHWYIIRSSNGSTIDQHWGLGTDTPVPGDYDGDGKTDIAVWRGQESTWYIIRSSNNQTQTFFWGASYAPYNDIPVPGDYDGDGKTDVAVFRPLNGHWYVLRSSNGATIDVALGQAGDTPVPGDYDGDGKTDFAVWRGSDTNWRILRSSDGVTQTISWGANFAPYFDVAVPGDYDGDGRTDIAVWRPAEGNWYIRRSVDNAIQVQTHGQTGDTLVPAQQKE